MLNSESFVLITILLCIVVSYRQNFVTSNLARWRKLSKQSILNVLQASIYGPNNFGKETC
jgi:hypothetical protein